MNPKRSKFGKVTLVGAGPGDPGLLTVKGQGALRAADALVYDLLANPQLLKLARPGAELICAGKRAGKHVLTQDQTNALLIRLARQGKQVVRLKGGDPFVFGRGGEEALALQAAGVEWEVVPGVSSGVAAPAYAGIPITHRGMATSAVFVTGQERSGKPLSAKTLRALAQLDGTLVFFMATEAAARICASLIRAGKRASTPAALIFRGTQAGQRSLCATLSDLPARMRQAGLGAPGLIVVGEVARLGARLNWFERRPLFGRRIVVTRSREQASKLSALLEDAGAEVLEAPSIRVKALPLGTAMRRALQALPRTDWVVFSSANGVGHFFARLRQLKLDARALGNCRLAAIGDSTAEALRAQGVDADLVPESFVAEGMLAALSKALGPGSRGARVLLARAAEGRDVLPQGLRKLGAKVIDLALYRTVPERSEIKDLAADLAAGKVDAVTFASSSTVAYFKALFTAGQWRVLKDKVPAYCLGPVTRSAAQAAGLRVLGMARNARLEDLLQTLTDAFARRGPHGRD